MQAHVMVLAGSHSAQVQFNQKHVSMLAHQVGSCITKDHEHIKLEGCTVTRTQLCKTLLNLSLRSNPVPICGAKPCCFDTPH